MAGEAQGADPGAGGGGGTGPELGRGAQVVVAEQVALLVWPWRDIAFLEVQLSARFRRRYPQGPSDFGKLVWEAMKKKGITRRDMAEKLGLPEIGRAHV